MSQKHQRYTLKTKESKQLLTDVSEKLRVKLETIAEPKTKVETVEADFGRLFLINAKPLLFKIEEQVLPILMAESILAQMPKAVVDMGAVRFVCNGADIMAPGVVRYEGSFDKSDIVVIVDVNHGKPLALGEALYSSKEAETLKQGPVVKSRHYVGDKIWNFAKTLID